MVSFFLTTVWGVYHYLLGWFVLSLALACLFVLVVFIRITVPRLSLETLSRLGWSTSLVLVVSVWVVYLAGFLLA